MLNFFFFFRNNSLHYKRRHHICLPWSIASIHQRQQWTPIKKLKCPRQNLKQAKYTEHRIEHKIRTQKKKRTMYYQKKRFQILCIQTLFDRMRKVSRRWNSYIPMWSKQYFIFTIPFLWNEFKKYVKIEDYVNFHKIIPNPSATIIHLQNEQNPPEEMLILPSFESFMENQNATHESVR